MFIIELRFIDIRKTEKNVVKNVMKYNGAFHRHIRKIHVMKYNGAFRRHIRKIHVMKYNGAFRRHIIRK